MDRFIAVEEYLMMKYGNCLRGRFLNSLDEDGTILSGTECLERIYFWQEGDYLMGGFLGYSAAVKFEAEEPRVISCRIRFWMDVEDDEISVDFDFLGEDDHCYEKHETPLDRFGIPMAKMDQVADMATNILEKSVPGSVRFEHIIPAKHLAKRMGLQVLMLPLYKMNSICTLLIYKDMDLPVCDLDSRKPVLRHFEHDTVIINTRVPFKAKMIDYNIRHECAHAGMHRIFYTFQRIASKEFPVLLAQPVSTEQIKSLEALEWQARIGADYLCYPAEMAHKDAGEYLDLTHSDGRNYGDCYESAIRTAADHRQIPVATVKRVFCYQGYSGAKGACNFQDGKYLMPFEFQLSSCRGRYTYKVDYADFMKAYACSSALRDAVMAGLLVFADGHVCINTGRYVRDTPYGPMLTREALRQVDKCCIRFKLEYQQEINGFRIGILTCAAVEVKVKSSIAELFGKPGGVVREAWNAVDNLRKLPADFDDTLLAHMENLHLNTERLAKDSNLCERTVRNITKKRTHRYDLQTVLKLAIGLKLSEVYARDFLRKAGYAAGTETHESYYIELILEGWELLDTASAEEIAKDYQRMLSSKTVDEAAGPVEQKSTQQQRAAQ